jgi:hypothetical protein
MDEVEEFFDDFTYKIDAGTTKSSTRRNRKKKNKAADKGKQLEVNLEMA